MTNLIDKKVLVTGLAVLAIAYFAKKYLTKTVKKADGSIASYIGHDTVGFV